MTQTGILWVYIALLVVGGVIGFVKGKSKVSLIMSVIFAALLSLAAAGVVQARFYPHVLLGALVVVFLLRVFKTRKFMPAGMLLILTVVTLGLLFL